ncbi:MAG: MerR family transcriptional regulator [Clostridia bacterium]|nr:MerR family transcriptional regulator [Clostridia bacterium]
MKIKSVCEKTGLTARTVRLYVEEELIAPAYSENYLGRRSYDFSEEDVDALRNIATLRSFGFSISDIRRIIESKENSRGIIKALCESKEKLISDEKNMLSVLLTLDTDESLSIEEIADKLRSASENRELPEEDNMSRLMYYLKNPKEGFKVLLRIIDYLLLFGAIAFQLFLFSLISFEWKYPHIHDWNLFCVFMVIQLLPVIVLLTVIIVSKLRKKRIMRGIGVLAVAMVCILFVPNIIVGIATPFESYTDSFDNYRKTDENIIHAHSFLNLLLPTDSTARKNSMADNSDAVYHYRHMAILESTTEILVEWNLEEKEFAEEVKRVELLFDSFHNYEGEESYYTYTIVEKGDYVCLIRYHDEGTAPFEKTEKHYHFFIFAYDETSKRVRYIYNYSGESGAIQPFYIDLDW